MSNITELKAAAGAALDTKNLSLENVEQEVTSATQLQTILQNVLAQLPSGSVDGPLPGEVRYFVGEIPEGWVAEDLPLSVGPRFEALPTINPSLLLGSDGVAFAVSGSDLYSIWKFQLYRFDPAIGNWRFRLDFREDAFSADAAGGLADGRILITAGGWFMLYDPVTNTRSAWAVFEEEISTVIRCVVPLPSGNALLFGSTPEGKIYEYVASTGDWIVRSARLTPKAGYGVGEATGAVLPSGRVLIAYYAGGGDWPFVVFDPRSDTVTPITVPVVSAGVPAIFPTSSGAIVLTGSVGIPLGPTSPSGGPGAVAYTEATDSWKEAYPWAPVNRLCCCVRHNGYGYMATTGSLVRVRLTSLPVYAARKL